MRRAIVLLLGLAALASASLAGVGDVGPSADEAGPSSAGAFNRWLFAENPHNGGWKARDYAEFQGMLEDEGVAGIVPTWQLWRVDAQYAPRCGTDYFAMPPKERWREIIPTLKLLRSKVIPVTGPLEVASGWRSPAINTCVRGASRSAHLNFKALDLMATQRRDRRELFVDLCAMQGAAGSGSRMGLGAYFNPDDPSANRAGRFHIDANGHRTWGFDYTAKSNPCPKLT
ncbi:MAG: D-Ala-D-Ala carboxypeptidase family metallohydrolase [Erythrobacter sp.]|nr:D-Ala-D-Ala carboxypeptidase family metallohydrolase [Erythrobacter sp.]